MKVQVTVNYTKQGTHKIIQTMTDLDTDNRLVTSGARFNKEVQPTQSLNLNSELTYSEIGNSDFSVTEQLIYVSSIDSE